MSVNIHGKEYFTVAERLNELNKNVDGNYTLTTEMVLFKDGVVVFKATLQIGENTFTGHAMEKEGSSTINKTSFIECAETSAIGRALASAGYLGSEFASADEVATAIANQDGSAPPTQSTEEASEKQMNYIKKLCAEKNIDEDEYVIEGMTKKDASESIETLMNIKQTDVPF
tara:strand:- start:230 stop:745 length:516 start_codon:yes stop_codon:yes gene_type:complete